jgi:hypothetical protein
MQEQGYGKHDMYKSGQRTRLAFPKTLPDASHGMCIAIRELIRKVGGHHALQLPSSKSPLSKNSAKGFEIRLVSIVDVQVQGDSLPKMNDSTPQCRVRRDRQTSTRRTIYCRLPRCSASDVDEAPDKSRISYKALQQLDSIMHSILLHLLHKQPNVPVGDYAHVRASSCLLWRLRPF